MAIINRDLDVSEQKEMITLSLGAIATGSTVMLYRFAQPATLQSVGLAATGVSNAMQLGFYKMAAAGTTVEAIGISNVVLVNAGTSGSLGFSGLAAAGSTLLNFNTGDVLVGVTSVSNGNVLSLAVSAVVKLTQDIVSYNGISS